ncbi:MAG: hypothetical protein GY702_19065, partial [Desulfobulbaceae bacterium]|nr:hypothetical protein [Desulfobulbaceae bacterium]
MVATDAVSIATEVPRDRSGTPALPGVADVEGPLSGVATAVGALSTLLLFLAGSGGALTEPEFC